MLTLPYEVVWRCDDTFSYAFLCTAARTELCFEPNDCQLGYWVADKLTSYFTHGLDDPCTGQFKVHIFEVMISAYRDVDLLASNPTAQIEYTNFRDTKPEEYVAEWFYKTQTYAPWRLVGAWS